VPAGRDYPRAVTHNPEQSIPSSAAIMYLWIKSLHLVSMVAWFAGLFYLPRLFVYHSAATDAPSIARFKIMERRLYRGITTPSAVLTAGFGLWLIALQGLDWVAASRWLQLKLALVGLLLAYHVYLGHLGARFAVDQNAHTEKFYRIINELPVFILVPVVILAEVKPF
jgi:putative membrane protein